MITRRAVPAVISVVALAFALTACSPAGGDPVPVTTASTAPDAGGSPTPSADPRDRISSIVIDGDSVSVNISEGGQYLDIPFTTDAETAVAQLSEALRLPETRSTLPASGCFPPRAQATWGGISFVWGDDWQRPPGAQFLATATAAGTSNGIAVALLGGQQVGAAESDVFAGAPGAYSDDFGSQKTLHYDVANGSPTGSMDDYWGAIAIVNGGVLTGFSSPIRYFYDC